VAYKPNPNFMVSASTSIGKDQNAYNAGVSLKFGKGETAKTKAELQKQVKYLNEKTIAQDEKIAKQDSENAALKDTVTKRDERIKALEAIVNKLIKK
ncbi:MAG: hypothetical protein Q4E34_04710, partial [Synergistaceae bacterium]|nr:hypothetical protein [Synergistaceae bacterium]